MPEVSERIRSAIRAYGAARHELVEAIQQEHPGAAVVVRRRFYAVVARGASAQLVTGRAVIHRPRPRSAEASASE